MNLPLYSIYLIYTGALAAVMLLLVPRKDIYRLSHLGVFYGGIIDVFWIVLIGLIGAGGYINYGPLGFKSIPFIPPLAWTIFFIVFLYLMPDKKPWNYLFALVGTGYSVMFSNVLANFGIFHWTFSQVLFPAALYFVWFMFVTWSYERHGKKWIHKNIRDKDKEAGR